jgi:hydrogenase maturation protease
VTELARALARAIRPRFASDYPKTLSAHDIGLKDLVESAALLGHTPEVVLIVVSVKTLPEGLLMEMSPKVAASLPRVAESVREAVRG